ncbi:MAG: flagellar export protein FliJ [Lachnospiraceae bacterium]|nr:flagellar export protein FliJ [Lachnospiraceae bacterium]
MAKFIFKMQNILSVKEKLEDQAKAEYALELVKLREEEEKKLLLEQKKLYYEDKLTTALMDTLDLRRIRQLEDGIEGIKYDIYMQELVILQQEEAVERARERLDEAMKERKIYEKLKERAFETFKQELNAAEQKEIDELVSFRHGTTAESED